MSDETDLVVELRAIAGIATGESTFRAGAGQHSFKVSYSGGSSSSVTFSASYDVVTSDDPGISYETSGYRDKARPDLTAVRPMKIELRRENDADLAAKREGVSVEWQSGDATFDPRVYVASPTSDPRLLAAVLDVEVRAGVLALLDLGWKLVTIDDDGEVRAYLNEFSNREKREDRGRRSVAAFARILANLPKVRGVEGVHPKTPFAGWTLALGIVGAAGWLTNFGYAGLLLVIAGAIDERAATELSVLQLILSVGASVIAGLVGATYYSRAVRERVRGTSTAHERASSAFLSSFAGVSVLVFGVVVITVALVDAR